MTEAIITEYSAVFNWFNLKTLFIIIIIINTLQINLCNRKVT